jgi:hypothetical protein
LYEYVKNNDDFQAKLSIAAYHNLSDEAAIEEQYNIVKNNGASDADNNGKPKVNGMDIMFRPWKADDEVSQVLRHGAWVGVMVKVRFFEFIFIYC